MPSSAGSSARSSAASRRKNLTIVALELRTLDAATREAALRRARRQAVLRRPRRASSPGARSSRWWSRVRGHPDGRAHADGRHEPGRGGAGHDPGRPRRSSSPRTSCTAPIRPSRPPARSRCSSRALPERSPPASAIEPRLARAGSRRRAEPLRLSASGPPREASAPCPNPGTPRSSAATWPSTSARRTPSCTCAGAASCSTSRRSSRSTRRTAARSRSAPRRSG